MLVALASLSAVLAAVGFGMVVNPYDDPVESPEAVVVLGGFGAERVELGIELAQRFGVPLVLSSSAADFGDERGFECGADAICLQPEPETTAGEAIAVAELMTERDWQRAAVVTSSHHTARTRILFRQCLGGRVSVVGATRPSGASSAERATEVAGIVAAWTIRRAC
jgi:uncharacterized SAM-binding protein YcdF (DUF218 family)